MSSRRPRPTGLFLIGIAAELAGMHPQTLRVYERRGLITPRRTARNTRVYSEADVALLRRIQELSEEGLNLAGIERVLTLEARLVEMEARLSRGERRAADLAAEMQEMTATHRAALADAHAARGQLVPSPRRRADLVPRYRRVLERARATRRSV